MTRIIVPLLLVLGQFSVAAAPRRRAVQPPPPVTVPAAIVTAAHDAAAAALKAGVPAVQIAVSRGGRIIYSEAFGMTNMKSATAATTRSVMQIGSVTKQFTAAAILRLAERGALTLDDRIEKFVPEFAPRGANITLRNLLNHTSGISRDWWDGQISVDTWQPATREQVIRSMNEHPFIFPAGKGWSCSNAGYMLLGYVIDAVTGRPYADFIHDEFAVPLGLIDTGVCATFNLPLPAGYTVFTAPNGSPMTTSLPSLHPSFRISSGSLCSTAFGLSLWSHLLANGGVLLPSSYTAMITPVSPATTAPAPYGFGLVVQKTLPHPAVWHDGGVEGFYTYLIYFSNEEVGVSVIINAYPVPAGAGSEVIALAVAKAALNIP